MARKKLSIEYLLFQKVIDIFKNITNDTYQYKKDNLEILQQIDNEKFNDLIVKTIFKLLFIIKAEREKILPIDNVEYLKDFSIIDSPKRFKKISR